jgi:type IV secretory pathway TrbD component
VKFKTLLKIVACLVIATFIVALIFGLLTLFSIVGAVLGVVVPVVGVALLLYGATSKPKQT